MMMSPFLRGWTLLSFLLSILTAGRHSTDLPIAVIVLPFVFCAVIRSLLFTLHLNLALGDSLLSWSLGADRLLADTVRAAFS